MIQIKRVYDKPAKGDGTRILVDRLWPRGLKKEELQAEGWLKEVAPSDPLRGWFGHEPSRWGEFRQRYFAELDSKPEVWRSILQAGSEGNVTLLCSAKDPEHNNAVALRDYLLKKLETS